MSVEWPRQSSSRPHPTSLHAPALHPIYLSGHLHHRRCPIPPPVMSRFTFLPCLFLLFLLYVPLSTSGLILRVPSGSEHCFFEEASKSDKIVGNFRVLEGGGRDIDIKVSDPFGKTVFEMSQKELERFQFFAQHSGTYHVCFSNKFSVLTGKTVKFNLYVGATLQKKDAAKSKHFSPLETNVLKLAQGIRDVSDWTSHMKSRERVHHQTVESTNFRVLIWRIAQIAVSGEEREQEGKQGVQLHRVL